MARKEASRLLACFFCFITTIVYSLALFREHLFAGVIPNPVFRTFGGRLKYLTMINLYIHFVYFMLSGLNSLIEICQGNKSNNKDCGKLKSVCNFIYTSLTFPAGIFVSVTFWVIFSIDRNLVMPETFDRIIPAWQNHIMHTLPFFAVLLDNMLTKHYYSKTFWKGAFPTIFFSICYLIWVFVIYHFGGFWVYPIMEVLRPLHRGVFFTVLLMFFAVLYKVGEILNSTLWPEEVTKLSRRPSLKRKAKLN